ncbi:MAG: WD40/YVTN/BNR-like repeat-containing protein, partial [Dehalococcoidia bacterium]
MRRVLTMMAAVAVMALAVFPAAGEAQAQTAPGWRQQLALPSGDLYDAVFATPDVVWAVGPGGIFRSADGGRSWSVAYIGSGATGWFSAVAAAPDGLHGWAVGGLGLIVATADGGKTWTRQTSGTQVNLETVAAVGNGSAIAAGVDIGFSDVVSAGPKPHVIVRTDDAGTSWRELRIAPDYEMSTVTFLRDGRHGWMAGARWLCASDPNAGPACARETAVFRSDDGGASWGLVNTAADLRRIAFVDATAGWATGYRCDGGVRCVPIVVRTADGGSTWTEVRALSESGYLGDIAGFDANAAAVDETSCDVPAAGAPCTTTKLMRTTDGGATWRATSSRGSELGPVLAFAGTARGVWAGVAPPRWSDDGAIWQAARFPVTVGSGAFDFANAQDGWFAASKLLRTRDGGATWAPVSGRALVGFAFVSADEGWGLELTCPTSAWCGVFDVLHTTDGGATWARQFTTPMLQSVPELDFTSASAGWLASSYDNRVFHTRDGGATWYEQRPPAPRAQIAFVGSLFAVATAPSCDARGDNCTAATFGSIDGGDTW